MKAYKLKGVSVVKDKNGSNILQVRLVERFINGKLPTNIYEGGCLYYR